MVSFQNFYVEFSFDENECKVFVEVKNAFEVVRKCFERDVAKGGNLDIGTEFCYIHSSVMFKKSWRRLARPLGRND